MCACVRAVFRLKRLQRGVVYGSKCSDGLVAGGWAAKGVRKCGKGVNEEQEDRGGREMRNLYTDGSLDSLFRLYIPSLRGLLGHAWCGPV